VVLVSVLVLKVLVTLEYVDMFLFFLSLAFHWTKNYNHITVTIRLKSVLFRVSVSNSPLFPFNSFFNIVHSLNVLQQT